MGQCGERLGYISAALMLVVTMAVALPSATKAD